MCWRELSKIKCLRAKSGVELYLAELTSLIFPQNNLLLLNPLTSSPHRLHIVTSHFWATAVAYLFKSTISALLLPGLMKTPHECPSSTSNSHSQWWPELLQHFIKSLYSKVPYTTVICLPVHTLMVVSYTVATATLGRVTEARLPCSGTGPSGHHQQARRMKYLTQGHDSWDRHSWVRTPTYRSIDLSQSLSVNFWLEHCQWACFLLPLFLYFKFLLCTACHISCCQWFYNRFSGFFKLCIIFIGQ